MAALKAAAVPRQKYGVGEETEFGVELDGQALGEVREEGIRVATRDYFVHYSIENTCTVLLFQLNVEGCSWLKIT